MPGGAGVCRLRSTRRSPQRAAVLMIENGSNSEIGPMYSKLYRHRDEFVVIDDVDAPYADRSGVRLLKCLCQTEEDKSVAWHTDLRTLERQGIAPEFTTASRVIIISNDWKTLNRNVAALQDRGHVLDVARAAAEVHRKAEPWFDDPEINRWFGDNLHRSASRRCAIMCGRESLRLPAGLD